jgi:hypothetical protein
MAGRLQITDSPGGDQPQARLNEAARTADATRGRWSRLPLRPVCVRDVEALMFVNDAPHLDAHNRAQ